MNDIINIEWIYETDEYEHGICFIAYSGWHFCRTDEHYFQVSLTKIYDHEHAARHALEGIAGEQGWRRIDDAP